MRFSLVATVVAASLLLMAAPGVAQAAVRGGVVISTVTPSIAREIYLQDSSMNGWAGFVFRLPVTAAGKTYTLSGTGRTGLENLDAYFYRSIQGLGEPCREDGRATETDTTETGTICPHEDGLTDLWGVVVLRTGAQAAFQFSYVA